MESMPLSFGQERLWFFDQMEPGNSAYNTPRALRLRGSLNVAALQGALDALIERHEILRTVYALEDGHPVQRVQPPFSLPLQLVDLMSEAPAARNTALVTLLQTQIHHPFDLSTGPILRAQLVRLAEDDHLLLFVVHHIAFDAWSLKNLKRELGIIYDAFLEGRSAPLDNLPIQYADYAVWQQNRSRGEALSEHIAYWKRQLSCAPVALDLPTDYPHPPVQTYRGTHYRFLLARPLVDALKALGRKERATLFMVLLACFKALLSRYSGQEDLVVGVPIAGRARVATEPLIGFFVNMLPLRTNLSGDPPFRELLARVRETALMAYEHQELPFERLVQELHPTRDLGRSAVFQTMFQLKNLPPEPPSWTALEIEEAEVESGFSAYDLSVEATESSEGIACTLEYNRDLFDPTTIERLADHYQRLLKGVVANPGEPLSRLPLLSEAERHLLAVEWNDTATWFPEDRCAHQLIEAQAERTADTVAVQDEHRQLTYGELDARANLLACQLRERGIRPGALVGICLPRSVDLVVGLLGILKAGGAYIPLDPEYPTDRIAAMLDDAAAKVVVTSVELVSRLPSCGAQILCVEEVESRVAGPEGDEVAQTAYVQSEETRPVPEDLAYILFTSGSTGRPKGVQISHRSLVNFLYAMRAQLGIAPNDVVCAITTVAFDIAALELFLPLVVGARVHIASRAVSTNGAALARTLEDVGASVLQATPATWRLLLAGGWQGKHDLRILCGGEALSRDLADRLLSKGKEVWNLYGPTETTIWSAVQRVEPGPAPVGIGRPIANTRLYVVDRHEQPVPVGVAGELWIGGVGVSRGYLHRPELTAAQFILDPFETKDESGMVAQEEGYLYKTGDLVRYRADGTLEFLGRVDDQVKIRGFRIEPGEIEAALRKNAYIRDVAVVCRSDSFGDPYLAAYVVPLRGHRVARAYFRQWLHERLPEYMIPSRIQVVEALPLTPNGKIDRQALPDAPVVEQEGHVAPRNPVERELANIWEQALGVSPIGATDNFFDLGGHSLLAAEIFTEIERLWGRRPPLSILFRAPTVELLAKALWDASVQKDGWGRMHSCLVAIQPEGDRSPLFCVHGLHGEVLVYLSIARRLGADQPVYALQARGLDGHDEPHTTIEAMATSYIEEIKRVQPAGPYYLCGYSSGAIIAFEMAHQLLAREERVALLISLDSGPKKLADRPLTSSEKHQFRLHHLKELVIWNYEHQSDRLRGLGTAMASWVCDRIMRRAGTDRVSPAPVEWDAPPPLSVHQQRVIELHWQAIMEYEYRPYAGRVTLIRTRTDPPDDWLACDKGWGAVAHGGVELHTVAGTHATLFEERYAPALARVMRATLHRANHGESSRGNHV